MFQILVVGGDNSECPLLVEAFQNGFGDGTANLRFRAAAKFVDQDEAAFIAVFHHNLHIGQMRRVGTQVIFDGLLITDIDKDTAEYAGMTALVQRNQHTAL